MQQWKWKRLSKTNSKRETFVPLQLQWKMQKEISIYESNFSSLKSEKRRNSINGKTSIHSSAMTMIDMTEKHAKRRGILNIRFICKAAAE